MEIENKIENKIKKLQSSINDMGNNIKEMQALLGLIEKEKLKDKKISKKKILSLMNDEKLYKKELQEFETELEELKERIKCIQKLQNEWEEKLKIKEEEVKEEEKLSKVLEDESKTIDGEIAGIARVQKAY